MKISNRKDFINHIINSDLYSDEAKIVLKHFAIDILAKIENKEILLYTEPYAEDDWFEIEFESGESGFVNKDDIDDLFFNKDDIDDLFFLKQYKTARDLYLEKEKPIKEMIAEWVSSPSDDDVMEGIRVDILWAWGNWSDDDLTEYKVNGVVPEDPTESFIKDWISNEPFEETLDCQNLEHLLNKLDNHKLNCMYKLIKYRVVDVILELGIFKGSYRSVIDVFVDDMIDHVSGNLIQCQLNDNQTTLIITSQSTFYESGKEIKYIYIDDGCGKRYCLDVPKIKSFYKDNEDLYNVKNIFAQVQDQLVEKICFDIYHSKIDIYHGRLINQIDDLVKKQWYDIQCFNNNENLKTNRKPTMDFIKNFINHIDFSKQSDEALDFILTTIPV